MKLRQGLHAFLLFLSLSTAVSGAPISLLGRTQSRQAGADPRAAGDVLAAWVVNGCAEPVKMTAAYSTFGNELQPLLVVAGIQPGKSYDLPERVKDQGTWKSEFTITNVKFETIGAPYVAQINQNEFNVRGNTKDYVFECVDAPEGGISIRHSVKPGVRRKSQSRE